MGGAGGAEPVLRAKQIGIYFYSRSVLPSLFRLNYVIVDGGFNLDRVLITRKRMEKRGTDDGTEAKRTGFFFFYIIKATALWTPREHCFEIQFTEYHAAKRMTDWHKWMNFEYIVTEGFTMLLYSKSS